MQLKKFYNIATKVSRKNNATTFGDLPNCLDPLSVGCGTLRIYKTAYMYGDNNLYKKQQHMALLGHSA